MEGREEAADSKGGKRAAIERAASEGGGGGGGGGASYRNMAEAEAALGVARALMAAGWCCFGWPSRVPRRLPCLEPEQQRLGSEAPPGILELKASSGPQGPTFGAPAGCPP